MLIALAARVSAAGLESQHAFQVVLQPARKLEWTLLTRVRARQHSTDLYQARVGTALEYKLHPRLDFSGGYLLTDQEDLAHLWGSSHRLYGAASVALTQALETRATVERFAGGTGRKYTRYRQRLRYEFGSAPLQPFLSAEAFVDSFGVQTIRYGAGVQRKLYRRMDMEVGYLLDARKESLGGVRHFIATTFVWSPGRARRE